MALITCAECGAQMSDKAAACPKCGAPNPAAPPPAPAPAVVVQQAPEKKRSGCGTIVLAGIFALFFFGWLGSREDARQREEKAAAAAAEEARIAAMTPEQRAVALEQKRLAAERERQAALRSEGLVWTYPESVDDMSGERVKSALIRSANKVEFKPPYSGPQRASLQLRKHPRFGNDVILFVERGQFVCGVSECTVRVRFGDGKVQSFTASGPTDYSHDTLFIRNYDRFLAGLRSAKTVTIEANIYQVGNVAFQFDTAGVPW